MIRGLAFSHISPSVVRDTVPSRSISSPMLRQEMFVRKKKPLRLPDGEIPFISLRRSRIRSSAIINAASQTTKRVCSCGYQKEKEGRKKELAIALGPCSGIDDYRIITYTDDRGVADQPYPKLKNEWRGGRGS